MGSIPAWSFFFLPWSAGLCTYPVQAGPIDARSVALPGWRSPMLVHDMREGLFAVQSTEQHTTDCSAWLAGGAERNMTIITPGLTSVLVGGLGSSQNRGVTVAPAASLENLGDMALSGQNSTDFLGAGVQKKIIRP